MANATAPKGKRKYKTVAYDVKVKSDAQSYRNVSINTSLILLSSLYSSRRHLLGDFLQDQNGATHWNFWDALFFSPFRKLLVVK
jgi:hypothetical protein